VLVPSPCARPATKSIWRGVGVQSCSPFAACCCCTAPRSASDTHHVSAAAASPLRCHPVAASPATCSILQRRAQTHLWLPKTLRVLQPTIHHAGQEAGARPVTTKSNHTVGTPHGTQAARGRCKWVQRAAANQCMAAAAPCVPLSALGTWNQPKVHGVHAAPTATLQNACSQVQHLPPKPTRIPTSWVLTGQQGKAL
jgi:hypothetical protein